MLPQDPTPLRGSQVEIKSIVLDDDDVVYLNESIKILVK